ncbi:MAG: substrate-binding domain-containing protein [Chitinophagaceae bacterium]|nr:substrate-binding domain-containing protein [Chitinophagaceae bacterium]MCW5927897.1 substrate-binding domain-containing protein [Chitinophagaceae bacterium]
MSVYGTGRGLLTCCISAILLIGFSGCTDTKRRVATGYDDLKSGTIHISVDESFKPVIDSQIKVFTSLYPEANIIAHYKAEAECLKDLMNDSIRMVIVTRGLSDEEGNMLKDTLGFVPSWNRMANDAIAVIVNPKQKDSLFSMGEIRSMMNGTSGYKLKPVLDGLSATSTVRYMIDSVLRGNPLSPDIMAATSSGEVIDFVSRNENAIGFVGVSWVGNPDDKDQLEFVNRVTVSLLEASNDKDKYIKPYQANIATKRYPMVRGLYYILKENYNGLGRGFANFLTHEKGQLIFHRAYLFPTKMNFSVREAALKE